MVPERTHSRANPARGLALIATAVIVGIFVLRNGWDTDGPSVSAAGDEAPADGSGTTAAPPDGSETPDSTAPVRPPAEVTVRVLNAAGVEGAAGDWTTALTNAGYPTIEPANAPETRDATAVLFVPGYDREAAVLADQIRAPANGVAPIGEPPSVDAGEAQIVVLIGTDLAESAPEG